MSRKSFLKFRPQNNSLINRSRLLAEVFLSVPICCKLANHTLI
jgi:hypothetical protein